MCLHCIQKGNSSDIHNVIKYLTVDVSCCIRETPVAALALSMLCCYDLPDVVGHVAHRLSQCSDDVRQTMDDIAAWLSCCSNREAVSCSRRIIVVGGGCRSPWVAVCTRSSAIPCSEPDIE